MRFLRAILISSLLCGLGVSATARADESPWAGQTVLVTGANRGLGLEFARQLKEAGANVIGTARKPEAATELRALGVRVEPLDVTDPVSVAALAESMGDLPLDVLLNNAGIFPSRVGFEKATVEDYQRVYDVNLLGPLRVTKVLLGNLRAGEGKLIMNMSSGLGSIANNTRGDMAGYRESKAALNMLTRSMAAELRNEGFRCIAMSPGWVRTDMGGPTAPLSAEESVRGMLAVLALTTTEDSGSYRDYQGRTLGW